MIQGSPEWFAARCGKVTASRIKDVMSKVKTGESSSRKNYRAQLVAEILTGTVEPTYINEAMRWGTDTEPLARAAYEIDQCVLVDQVGMVDHPTMNAGASPDGLVGSDGLVEIKCPNTATHIDYLLSREVPCDYYLQMQWLMACTGRKWTDFVSYDPRLPSDLQMLVLRVPRDDVKIAELEAEVSKFIGEVNELVKQLTSILTARRQAA